MISKSSSFETDLDQNRANFVPLSPLGFLKRSAQIYPDHPSVIHQEIHHTWSQTHARCKKLASALIGCGVKPSSTVSIMAPNTPAMYEAHFGVPMTGAVLNTINVRLDAQTIAFILDHAETEVVLVDVEFSKVMEAALGKVDRDITVIDILDDAVQHETLLGSMDYETFISQEEINPALEHPVDEWDAIALNYTSGTTGNPKGVVYHYRGAYLNSLSNALNWKMHPHPTYLWTLPMFHCNGWCFPWTIAMLGGTNVCLRKVEAAAIYNAIVDLNVTHFCGAPIVLGLVVNASNSERRQFDHKVEVMTAAAPPPAAVLEKMEQSGFHMTHVYGLTETYGPSVVCEWKDEWNALDCGQQATLKSRQGVPYTALQGLEIKDPDSMADVPADGKCLGEAMFRGNIVMKGYLKNPKATSQAFADGWFHSGDLGVMHPDHYIQLKDRSKDIIISGGENISSIEIEDVLFRHPAVMEAAVVALDDDKWGEVPCAFVLLNPAYSPPPTEDDLIEHCRNNMARYKAPKKIVFGELPKTSTGKIQKFILRERANS
ncbi:MAG: acyl-CoA synthetase [Acidiferrobacterales bacterium]|nr:acyl-CoA synthetase [Acidiferrobacterales bacterium]